MTRSSRPSPGEDLELPRSVRLEDLPGAWRATVAVSFQDYLRFLARFGHATPAALRARRGPKGDERFRL